VTWGLGWRAFSTINMKRGRKQRFFRYLAFCSGIRTKPKQLAKRLIQFERSGIQEAVVCAATREGAAPAVNWTIQPNN
jgi:hypothetical protein